MTISATGRQAAFTLIEILVVISLIIILVAALVVNVISVGQRAYISATKSLFQRIELGTGTYKDRTGFNPADGLDAPVTSRDDEPIQSSACLYEYLGRPLVIEKPAPGGRTVVERYPSAVLRFRESELERIPGELNRAEVTDAWGIPIHYDRLEGTDSYSMQEDPAIHLNPPEYHPVDPREVIAAVATQTGQGQNPGSFDLWSHGLPGHDPPEVAEDEFAADKAVAAIICNWAKPKE